MDRPPEVMDALAAWRTAKQLLDGSTPSTVEWQRLRLVERHRRLAYQRLNDGHRSTAYKVTAADDGDHWIASVQGGPDIVTRAHRVDQALQMIRELIATVDGLDPRSVKLEVDFGEEGQDPSAHRSCAACSDADLSGLGWRR